MSSETSAERSSQHWLLTDGSKTLVITRRKTSVSTSYIIEGIRKGFRIGFQHERCLYMSAKSNMASTIHHPELAAEYLAAEIEVGRIVEVPNECTQEVQISRFGFIPKSNQPGKRQLVLDLSSPDGASINNGINPELCSVVFVLVDTVIERIVKLGRDTLLAQVDIEHAYHNVPVHPDDRQLLGMKWKESLYVDMVSPFGLRSVPKSCQLWLMH